MDDADSWETRYTYAVTEQFADVNTQFTLNTVGQINIQDGVGGALINGAPVVIVSHGNNRYGGVNLQGAYLPDASTVNERENTRRIRDNIYISANHSSNPANEFDDIVMWVSPSVLFNRMVAAGRLP